MASKHLKDFVSTGKKILAVGRNYIEHTKELGNPVPSEPLVFIKPTTTYIKEGELIKMPRLVTELSHEVELGLVIGKKGFQIDEGRAMDHIGGYVLALDMTDRKSQENSKAKGLPWTLAKCFDTSCPVSDFITKDTFDDPHDLLLWLMVNDEMRQEGSTKDMIFSIPYLISFLSQYFTLEEGDVILTGTPAGVGPVKAGDQIVCGIGETHRMVFNVAN